MKFRALVVLSAVTLTLTACGSNAATKDDPGATKRSSAKLVERSPLTGLELKSGQPSNPVFVVKIENTFGGQPQYALNKADLVIEELVEGGLTRLAALYYSKLPSKVGHVRSMRATDIGIAGPVNGQIVASGGAGGTYKRVKRAGIRVWSEDHDAPGFSSDPAKMRPYNRLINLKTVAAKAKKQPITQNYLPFRTKPAATPSAEATAGTAAKTAKSATVRFSNSTTTRWAFKNGTWMRVNSHAAPGQDFRADTLLVLSARVTDAGYRDPAGNPVPETVFEGSGDATILRGDTVVKGKWKKTADDRQITLTDSTGAPVELDPGHVWIELIPRDGGSVSLG